MNQPRARMLQRFSLGGLGLAGVSAALLGLFGAGCGGGQIAGGGQSTARTEEGLSGCHGKASSAIPSSGDYYLTSFGFSPSDNGEMSCGSYTQGGNWYYAASRQRYGCGAHIRIEGNGKCVVAQTDDYGPDVCVESAAGRPIIDASPLVSEHLFGVKSAGYSDHFAIEVTEVARTTPLGPCDAGSGSGSGSDPGSGSGSGSGTGTAPSNPAPPAPPPPSSGPSAPAGCHSATLDADVGGPSQEKHPNALDRHLVHLPGRKLVRGPVGLNLELGLVPLRHAQRGRPAADLRAVDLRRHLVSVHRRWMGRAGAGWGRSAGHLCSRILAVTASLFLIF